MGKKSCSILIVGMIVLAVLIVKAVLFFTAEPKVTVNYVAELNRMSRSADYDPNDNAAAYYEKASFAYVETPERVLQAYTNWPGDMNELALDALRKWLGENSPALEYLERATAKPYLWVEGHNKDDYIMSSRFSGPANIYKLCKLLDWRARLKAIDGESAMSLKDLLTCWKVGDHYTNTKLLLDDQLQGLRIKEHALKTAFLILDLCKIDAENLMLWQKNWEQEFKRDEYIPRFETERLVYYDLIQRNFVDNGRGTGRLAWKKAKNFTVLCHSLYNLRIFLSCFTGPNRNEVTEIVNSVFGHYEEAVKKTPWEIRTAEQTYRAKIERVVEKKPILDRFIPPLDAYRLCYYRIKACSEALITAVSILRYKADKGSYPKNLDELIQQKYLTKLPRDPFSNGPLVYNLLDDDFELYSIEKDFRDDGAGRFPGGNPISGIPEGDEVFWPPFSKGRKNIKFYKLLEKNSPQTIRGTSTPKTEGNYRPFDDKEF